MKFTLITGASSGIGEAFARRLAADGHNLVLVARSEDKLHQLCDELMLKHKITAHYIAADLTEFEADKRLFEETERHGFEIDWLVNNAGFGSMGDFAGLELERELQMIDLNISALVALTHHYLPAMRARKSGVIVNVSSTASFQPIPYMATYAATKAFVTSFSEAVNEENRAYGITVTALCPGPTDTNFFAVANAVPFTARGVQTSEDVVENALKAVRAGKAVKVSGFRNYIGSVLGTLAPDALVTRTIGSFLRPKLKKKV
ncbi:MAG: SDR family oxidoreductase [Acidobacteria bacterium]|nr:SDR family oxidoreductase [Acidobacteriota bacterium]